MRRARCPTPNATVVIKNDGSESTGVQRLETIVHHWNAHLEEMAEAAEAASA